MKTFTRLAILTVAAAVAVPAQSEAAWVCDLKKGKELNLRSCPKTACRVKNSYLNGTKVAALKSSGTNWIYVKVKRDGKKGWMKEPFLCGDDIDFG